MTSALGRVAGGVTALGGLWTLYVYYAGYPGPGASCPIGGCQGIQFGGLFGDAVLVLALVVLFDGALGVWGVRYAYAGGAVLSAVLLLLMAYTTWADAGYSYLGTFVVETGVGAVLAAAAVMTDVLAARGRGGISEQANPMNLPVFG